MMRVGITVQKNSRLSHFTELNVDFAHKTKLIRNCVNIRLLCTVTYNDTRACFWCRHVKDFSTNSNTDSSEWLGPFAHSCQHWLSGCQQHSREKNLKPICISLKHIQLKLYGLHNIWRWEHTIGKTAECDKYLQQSDSTVSFSIKPKASSAWHSEQSLSMAACETVRQTIQSKGDERTETVERKQAKRDDAN